MKYTVLAGRIIFGGIFVMAALGHFSPETVLSATEAGVPQAAIIVPFAGVIGGLGGLSLLLGYKARLGAMLLVAFLVPVTVIMHNFWTIADVAASNVQRVMFLKNLSMLGSALLVAHFGSGPLSLDNKLIIK